VWALTAMRIPLGKKDEGGGTKSRASKSSMTGLLRDQRLVQERYKIQRTLLPINAQAKKKEKKNKSGKSRGKRALGSRYHQGNRRFGTYMHGRGPAKEKEEIFAASG